MNAARKLIAFIRDAATGISAQLEHPECTVGDLQDARRTVAHMRADLVELDQRISAEITRRIARPNPLVPPPQATMREVLDYERRLRAGRAPAAAVGPDLGRGLSESSEDEVLASIAQDRAVEPPVHTALAIPRAALAPGRYRLVNSRLIAMSGTISAPGRKAS